MSNTQKESNERSIFKSNSDQDIFSNQTNFKKDSATRRGSYTILNRPGTSMLDDFSNHKNEPIRRGSYTILRNNPMQEEQIFSQNNKENTVPLTSSSLSINNSSSSKNVEGI